MAVAFNNSDARAQNTGGSTSVSFSYTASSGSNRLLVAQSGGSASVSAVSYAGASLTLAGSTGSLSTWRKTAPATGANTLAFTVSTYAAFLCNTADFTGVDQTTPLGTKVEATGTSSAPATGSVTVPANGAAYGGFSSNYVTSGSITATNGTLAGSVRDGSGNSKGAAYRLSTGNLSWSLPSSPAWQAHGFPINAAVPPPELSGEAVLAGISADGGFLSVASSMTGEAILAGIAADGGMGLAPGVITTPVLKNNTGTILASVTGIVANVYDASTGALVVRKTGLSSDGSGIVTFSDVLLAAGTTYAYELDLSASSQGRRLPTGVAT